MPATRRGPAIKLLRVKPEKLSRRAARARPPSIDSWAKSATETVTQPSRTPPSRGAPKRKHQASLNLQSWGGRTRTSNFPVNSRAVCQLTYTPRVPQPNPTPLPDW